MPRRERRSVVDARGVAAPAKSPKVPAAPDRPVLVVTGSVGHGAAGPGGWGFVMCFPSGQEVEAGGMERETTVHRMALTAVIRALERVGPEESAPVRVVTSSRYTVDGASGRAERRANLDLWGQLDGLARGRRIAWEWEPDETMYLQDRAAELANLALKRGPHV